MRKPAEFDQNAVFKGNAESQEVRLFCCNMFYSGKALNISPAGMFISTKKCIPAGSVFLVLFRNNNELLKAFVRVRETIIAKGGCEGIEVEVLNHNSSYLEFVNSLKPAGKTPGLNSLVREE